MSAAPLLNRLWRASCELGKRRFARSLLEPGEVQRASLMRLLRCNADTAFGRRHDVASIRTPAAFQASIPIGGWEATAPWVDRIAAGEPGVLTRDPVTRLVPTGGSSGGAKLIPWTRTLASGFSAAIAPWLCDLYTRHPGAADGPAYWSVSPLADDPLHASKVAIGFDDDSAYVGRGARSLVAAALAVPACVRFIRDPQSFRYATMRCLLARRDLALMSVWHPSFLELLLDAALLWRDRLTADIAAGGISPPTPLSARILAGFGSRLVADPDRADELRRLDWDRPSALWPRLAVVSCWGDGPAARDCAALKQRLRDIPIQPKGLLATEGVMSIPWCGRTVLAVTSHVYEFIDEAGRARWADDLESGATYDIALTTGGGLYRYRIGDRVRVDGFIERAPCLSFLGRGKRVVDLRGEKLDEAFVSGCIDHAAGAGATFALLAPDHRGAVAGYTLYIDHPTAGLAARLDEALAINPQYRTARRLGQLAPVRIFRVCPGAGAVALTHLAASARLGSTKPAALHGDDGWSRRFSGSYVEGCAP